MVRILVVSPNQAMRGRIVDALPDDSRQFEQAGTLDEARKVLETACDLVIIDFCEDGMPDTFLKEALESPGRPEVIVLVDEVNERVVGRAPIGFWSQCQGAFGFVSTSLAFDQKSPKFLTLNVDLALGARRFKAEKAGRFS